MALRDTLRNLIGIPENDYDSEYDDDMQAGNVEQEEEEQMPSPSLSSDRKHNKVVNIPCNNPAGGCTGKTRTL